MGGGVLRSWRGAGQPGAAILDAADPGDVRAPRAGRDGLHLHRFFGAHARGDPARDAAGRDAAVSAVTGAPPSSTLSLVIGARVLVTLIAVTAAALPSRAAARVNPVPAWRQ